MLQRRNYNCFDVLIVIALVLLAFGGYGGSLQPVRVFSILLIPYTLFEFKNALSDKIFVKTIGVFIIFLIYFFLSYLWTCDREEWFKEAIYYPVHFNLFLLLYLFAKKAMNPFGSIILGWIVFIVATFPIAFVELIFDKHLASSLSGEESSFNLGGGIRVSHRYASANFGNYNCYNVILGFSIPFILSGVLYFQKRFQQIICFGIASFTVVIIMINASRGTMLGYGIIYVVFFFYIFKNKRSFLPIFLLILIVGVVCLFHDALLSGIQARLFSKENIFEDSHRTGLIADAFVLINQSFWMGTGGGSLITVFEGISRSKIFIPHNLFLEILVQYGVIFLGVFLIFLFHIFISALKQQQIYRKMALLAALFSLPILSVVNSGYLLMPVLWCYFSSLLIFASYKDEHHRFLQ